MFTNRDFLVSGYYVVKNVAHFRNRSYHKKKEH